MNKPGRVASANAASKSQVPGTHAEDERRLIELCTVPAAEALERLGSSLQGLSAEAVERRRAEYGPNELSRSKHLGFWADIYHRCRSPLVIQLLVIAADLGRSSAN